MTASTRDHYDWSVDIDEVWPGEPQSLILYLFDLHDDSAPIDCLGGIEVRFWVSDHGNIHIDPEDAGYIEQLVDEMIEGLPQKVTA